MEPNSSVAQFGLMIIPISRQTTYCDIVDTDVVDMDMVDMDMMDMVKKPLLVLVARRRRRSFIGSLIFKFLMQKSFKNKFS